MIGKVWIEASSHRNIVVYLVLLVEEVVTLFVEFTVDFILVYNQPLDILLQQLHVIFNNPIILGDLVLDDLEDFGDLVVLEVLLIFACWEDDDFEAF